MTRAGRTCVGKGYVYRFRGKTKWRTSSDERWAISMRGKSLCGRKVGERTIDGVRVVVVTVGGRYYAAQPMYARKAP